MHRFNSDRRLETTGYPRYGVGTFFLRYSAECRMPRKTRLSKREIMYRGSVRRLRLIDAELSSI